MLSQLHLGKTKANLQAVWRLVLSLDQDFPSTAELPQSPHHTAGILFNFDIKPGTLVPQPTLYIPTKHYGQDDLAVAQGLATYLKSQGRDDFVPNYMRALEGLCAHRRLDSACGIRTYYWVWDKVGGVDLDDVYSAGDFLSG